MTTNIVVLGTGRVSRALTAWCSAQNIARSFSDQQQQQKQQQQPSLSISVYTSAADIGAESLINDLPWLAGGSGNKSSRLIQRAANVAITADPLTAAKQIAAADAVFFAAPMTQAAQYLTERKPIRDALAEQQRTRSCPLFLISRGISLNSWEPQQEYETSFEKNNKARAIVLNGVRTSHTIVESILHEPAPLKDGQSEYKVYCAANSLADDLVRECIVPLGGLLSHRALLDPATALVSGEASLLSSSSTHNDDISRSRLQIEKRILAASLAVPPPMFTPGGTLGLHSELLENIFGAGTVEQCSTLPTVEKHALYDASLIAASFGNGIIKSLCADNFPSSSRVYMTQRALGAFWGKMKADETLLSRVHAPRNFDTILAQAALGTGGMTAVGNVAELGRRISEHASVADAEASLFDVREGGHSPSMHRTMHALSFLSQHEKKSKKGDNDDDADEHTVFSIVGDALTGFRPAASSAHWLSAPQLHPSDDLLSMPHAALDDLMRLDKTVEAGVIPTAQDMLHLVRNIDRVEVMDQLAMEQAQRQGQAK